MKVDELLEEMRRYTDQNGSMGVGVLADVAGRESVSVERWLDGTTRPPRNRHKRLKLALACGCSEERALELAEASSDITAKETA